MAFDKDKVKNSLSLEDVYTFVEELGGNPSLHGSMLMIDTICHNSIGEGSHKLYYYDNTKLFKCYTDCGEYFDIFELMVKVSDIQYAEEWELPRAVAFVANRFNIESIEQDGFQEQQSSDWLYFNNLKKLEEKAGKEKKNVELKEYDEKILRAMPTPIIKPWLDEGITRETMKTYEISYYPKEAQIVIPHRDKDNRLIGVRGRTLVREDGERYGKYRPIIINSKMYNHPLGFNLYGLNLTKANIESVKKVVVFEGEKSVMLYDSYFGTENNISVASCGSSITQHQFEILRDLGVQELIIAFDKQFKEIGDDEFKRLTKNIKKLAEKYKNYMTISCLFDKTNILNYKDSPIDQGKEVFIQLFQDRIIL